MTKDKDNKRPEKNSRNRYKLLFQREQHRAGLVSHDRDFSGNGPQPEEGNRNQTGLPHRKNNLVFAIISQVDSGNSKVTAKELGLSPTENHYFLFNQPAS